MVQTASSYDKAANRDLVRRVVAEAAEGRPDLVVVPEAIMSDFATEGGSVAEAAEPLDGEFVTTLRKTAVDNGVAIVAGMFERSCDQDRPYNTLLAVGADGSLLGAYRKIHLYDAFGSRESDTVAPGNELVTFGWRDLTIGLATCYDLRFADQFTALGRLGAELIVVPASWGAGPGKEEQWDLLTRARAADAQAWLLACDQAYVPPSGTDPLGIGRSSATTALGQTAARLDAGVGTLHATIEPSVVAAVRARVPIL